MNTTATSSSIDEYLRRTPRSRELFAAASLVIPGGVSRATLAFQPYPFYAATAAGAVITDVDGNDYVDLINNFTSLPHGHGHPATTAAVAAELSISSAIGTAHPLEAAYAAELQQRLPAMQRLHFTTTGSEAVGFAVRVARAHTGRDRILKFEGAFHGSHNELYQNIGQPPLRQGSSASARPESAGLEPTKTVTAVYNDVGSLRDAFSRWGTDIAGVVVEPFLGNSALITADRGFLDAVFEVAHAHGALVIFDEVQSLRAGFHGAQGRWGYTPDLVAIGKIIGGGYPLAAFGGGADLMDVLSGEGPRVLQTGTFTASPVFLAAGQAAMRELGRDEYAVLEARTERLRSAIREEFARAHVPVHVNGIGSMFNIAVSAEPVTSYRAHRRTDTALFSALRLELLLRGVLVMPRGTGCLSTAITDGHVDRVILALRESLAAVARL
ncbi:aspartate aminotransferase family protein [Mycolicibacterium brisbanense]